MCCLFAPALSSTANVASQKQRQGLQDFDRQLQRALNYENAEAADAIRSRRDALNQAVEKFQVTACSCGMFTSSHPAALLVAS